jgi:hypothetical protein
LLSTIRYCCIFSKTRGYPGNRKLGKLQAGC